MTEENQLFNTTNKNERRIVVVSDGTGETAAQIVKAAMVQFPEYAVDYARYKNVRTEAQIDAICEDAASNDNLIVYTIVSPQLREFLSIKASQLKLIAVDLIGPLLKGLVAYFGKRPEMVAGLLHDINEEYFDRIEAMEYTIHHDDGRDLTEFEKADLIILGISRTSKTPLSMYLSTQGWRVVNIPIILGFQLPKELLEVDPRKVVALTINSEHLATIRRARLQKLGQSRGGEYASLNSVEEEIEYANEIFKRNRKWAVFNVTGKALEETASEVIKLMESRGLTPNAKQNKSRQNR